MLPFEQVYRENVARVYGFCLSRVRDRGDAEDLAAEVFVSAYASYARTRPDPARVLAWLLRIARNAVIDHHRRQRRWALLSARFAQARDERGVDVESQVLLHEDVRVLAGCMRRLNERDRALTGLRIAAGLPYADVGAILGISEHAATVATRRALDRLRRHYEATC